MSLHSLLLLAAVLAPGQAGEHANPLFRELRDPGLTVGHDLQVPLPAPTMADGLDAAAQRTILQSLASEDYPLDELLRNSVVAPHIFRLRDLQPSAPAAPSRGADVWFIAYGDLKTVTGKGFLDRVLNKQEGTGQTLTAADLARRHITLKPEDEKYESYGHIVYPLLDRVEISATGRSYWSQTADSVLVASRLDPRFLDDPEFPDQWRPLQRTGDGHTEAGAPHPYDGAAYYIKFTRLSEPRGALFVEAHVVFTEPVKWFNGANLLRSKLPPVIQARVRAIRRELLKAGP